MSLATRIPQPGAGKGLAQIVRFLEHLPAGAYACDAEGLITYFNPRAVELWGREPKLNHPVDRYCGSFKLYLPDGTPIHHDQCWMARALREQKGFNGQEIVVERPDGRRLTALAHANPVFDDDGVLLGAANVLVDITGRKQAEDAQRQDEARKNDFIAMLAHELRNPLAPLRNALELLRLDGGDPATVEHATQLMGRQVDHLVRLVDDLMDVARIAHERIHLRRERVELASVIALAVEAARPHIEESKHALEVEAPREPIVVDVDAQRLAQALANLLDNAARFTDPGGRISISASLEGGTACVRVRDSGIGIAAEMLLRVFDRFTRVDDAMACARGGLGIGLSVARRLVEMHGGSIEASSEGKGAGSEFVVRLPALGAPRPAPSHRDEPAAADAGDARAQRRFRVLVVDDYEASATTLARLLRLFDHDVRVAYDGVEALEVAAEFRPEVAFLDLGLPRLSGYDVARRMRAETWGAGTFLVALTGWGQDDARKACIEAGFDVHLIKPAETAALRSVLARVPRERAAPPDAPASSH